MGKKRIVCLLIIFTLLIMTIAIGCGRQKTEAPKASPPSPAGTPSETAKAQVPSYPASPIKMTVPRGAGGSTDAIARLLQPYLEKYLGVPVVIENQPGGGGVIGNDMVYKSKPDGYTLLFTVSITDILKQVAEGTPWDFRKFTPVYNIGGGDSNLIAVKADSDMKTFNDFVAKAKSKGLSVGKLTGINVTSIALGFLVEQVGIPLEKLRTVPYEDGKQATLAVAGGHVDAAITQPVNVLSLVKDGKIRILTTFTKQRLSSLPDVPTFMELYPKENNYYEIYQSIMAPPETPDNIIQVLNTALDKATSDPEFVTKAKGIFTLSPMKSKELGEALNTFFKQAEKMKPILDQLAKFEKK